MSDQDKKIVGSITETKVHEISFDPQDVVAIVHDYGACGFGSGGVELTLVPGKHFPQLDLLPEGGLDFNDVSGFKLEEDDLFVKIEQSWFNKSYFAAVSGVNENIGVCLAYATVDGEITDDVREDARRFEHSDSRKISVFSLDVESRDASTPQEIAQMLEAEYIAPAPQPVVAPELNNG